MTTLKSLALVRRDPAGARYLAAYRETLRELSQLETDELLPINIDVPGRRAVLAAEGRQRLIPERMAIRSPAHPEPEGETGALPPCLRPLSG